MAYVENRGAAFGIMHGMRGILIIVPILAVLLILWVLFRRKVYGTLAHISLIMVAAGAIGNVIDRISLGYVIDMFYVKAINFPVFNVADIFVTVGGVLLCIYIVFFHEKNKRAALAETGQASREKQESTDEDD